MTTMATIQVNDVYEIKYATYCAGNAGINVLHYACTAVAGTGSTDIQLATQLDALMAPLYKACMAGIATYYGIRAQRVTPLPKSLSVVVSPNIGVGLAGAAALPGQVCGIITLQTAIAGRKNRGRVYVPFPASAQNDATNDTPVGGYKNEIQSLGVGLTSTIVAGVGGNTSTMVPVIYHRKDSTFTLVVSIRANQKWATQRRRSNYGQLNPYPPI